MLLDADGAFVVAVMVALLERQERLLRAIVVEESDAESRSGYDPAITPCGICAVDVLLLHSYGSTAGTVSPTLRQCRSGRARRDVGGALPRRTATLRRA